MTAQVNPGGNGPRSAATGAWGASVGASVDTSVGASGAAVATGGGASIPDVSIVIVNYNVKEFLANCLQSIRRAQGGLSLEVIVVDNASRDGSREMLEPRFPDVTFIWNETNEGFGRANNRAIAMARGRHTLLLNPDTLLQEDTLATLSAHMEANPRTGACGCKILNPDGTFAPESRRTIPTISSSVSKALGLTGLFPTSRTFARYYLGWLPEDQPGPVPVLSGSFMFFRTEVLRQVGGFDERFFMYGEDIDLCLRVAQAGWGIDYVPATSIIHYKGESTKKDDIDYIRHFNQAMYLFFDKHHSGRLGLLFRAAVGLAVFLRAVLSFAAQKVRRYRHVAVDLVWINASLLLSLAARWGFDPVKLGAIDYRQFLWLNALTSGLYLLFHALGDLERQRRFEVSSVLKSVAGTYAALILVTFFARDLAFSRLVVVGAFVLSVLGVGAWRLLRVNQERRLARRQGRWVRPRILAVGVGERTDQAVERLRSSSALSAEILGLIHQNDWQPSQSERLGTPVIGSIAQLPELVRRLRITHVIFVMDAVSNTELLGGLIELRDTPVSVRIIPQEMDFMIGKADVEYLDDLPLMEVPVGLLHPLQRVIKRAVDLLVSVPLVVLPAPIAWPLWRAAARKPDALGLLPLPPTAPDRDPPHVPQLRPAGRHGRLNTWRLLMDVARGRMTLVGATLRRGGEPYPAIPRFRAGIWSYAHLNRSRIRGAGDLARFEQAYLRNYTFWLDLEVLLRSGSPAQAMRGFDPAGMEDGTVEEPVSPPSPSIRASVPSERTTR